MAYTMRSAWFVGQMTLRLRGIGAPGTSSVRTPRVNVEDLGDIEVFAPPVTEQRRIVEFLDDQVTRIDNILAARQEQATLWAEWWGRALEEGLRARSDPMVPLRSQVWWQEGPGILAKDFRVEGIPILRISHLRAVPPSLQGCEFVDETEGAARWGHFLTQVGDLMISGSASAGAMAVWITSTTSGAIPYTGLIRTRPRSDRLHPDFMRYYFLSACFNDQIDRLKQGIGIQHWGPTHLAQVKLPLPSPSDQERRMDLLRRVETDFIAIQHGLREGVQLLSELKRSLISAAVSGEFDVKTADGSRVEV